MADSRARERFVHPIGSDGDQGRSTPDRREMAFAAVLLLGLLLIPLLLPQLRVLLMKPLWLDELHTWLLARAQPGQQLVDRLAGGADFNPPLLFAIDWAMLRLFGGLPAQVVLRLTSIFAIWAALLLLYRMARERLGVLPSAVGATAVLAHSILLGQVHEARFYAPWFALTVALALAMQSVVEHRGSWWRLLTLALLTAATCLIHYFGIISVACLALGFALKVRSPSRIWPVAAAIGVGALSLVAWLPVYEAQRHVLTVPTWIAAPTLRSSVVFVLLFLAWVPYVLVLGAAAYRLWRTTGRTLPSPTIAQSATIGLVALPLILVPFSYLVQPTLIGRYALPAVAGMCCLVALATSVLPRRMQTIALVGMVATYSALLGWKTVAADKLTAQARGAIAGVNAVARDPRPVLSLDRNVLYMTALSKANHNPRLAYLVMPVDTIYEYLKSRHNKTLNDITIIEQDVALAHHRTLGFPAVLTLGAMRLTDSFFLLIGDDTRGSALPAVFSGFRSCRVNARVLLFESSPGTPTDGTSIRRSPQCPSGSVGEYAGGEVSESPH
ncbi:MAG: hypothetical protein ABI601_02235 [bacterium]